MSALLDVRTTAVRLGVCPQTVRSWIRDGRLPAIRLSHRVVRIPEDALAGFLRARGVNLPSDS